MHNCQINLTRKAYSKKDGEFLALGAANPHGGPQPIQERVLFRCVDEVDRNVSHMQRKLAQRSKVRTNRPNHQKVATEMLTFE